MALSFPSVSASSITLTGTRLPRPFSRSTIPERLAPVKESRLIIHWTPIEQCQSASRMPAGYHLGKGINACFTRLSVCNQSVARIDARSGFGPTNAQLLAYVGSKLETFPGKSFTSSVKKMRCENSVESESREGEQHNETLSTHRPWRGPSSWGGGDCPRCRVRNGERGKENHSRNSHSGQRFCARN